MQKWTKISCVIDTTDPACPLGMEIWLNQQKVFDCDHVICATSFEHELLDHDSEHLLEFVLKNKTSNHTCLDQQGNIVSDACLIIKDMIFDNVKLGHCFYEQAVYNHSYNTKFATTVEEKFYGNMGCNGVVSFKFSTPLYLWLLEHL